MTTPAPVSPAAPAPARADTDLALPAGDEIVVTTDDGAALVVTVAPPSPAAGGDAPPGPPVVLSHCWTGSRAVWAPVARRLVAAGRRVVLYDQRGHGASNLGRAPFTVDRLGDDLAAVVEAVDLRAGVLAGHSMGGMSVMACACRHPCLVAERARGLVLVATAAHGLGRQPLDRLAHAVLRGERANRLMARPAVGRALVRPSFGRAPQRAHVDATRALFAATPAQVRDDAGAAMRLMDLRAALEPVALPAVVLLGRRDRLITNGLTREIAARIPGARVAELAGAGHMLPMERPAEVAAAILGLGGTGSM
jgi:pimeloyl-ACP methyl ester carboxylesterase